MGVPGFFLWLWRRYKGENFVFTKNINDEDLKNKIENIDYFLIDTNCLLHPMCFKILAEQQQHLKNVKEIDFDDLENKMMNECLRYLDEIIDFVKPKKGVMIAIDGVAPIAKIKQQRLRRYKSVHDNNLRNNIKKKYGKDIDVFWNNSAITPGTKFMEKLDERILLWINNKKDSLEYIYSSCKEPSEGEHKLLQFIKKNKHSFKQSLKYAIYGLDADLIFLALASNVKDIFLVRESVHLKKGNDELSYVSIDTVRECIYHTVLEMTGDNLDILKTLLKEENIIDDFIFLGYLLGNDFLPHLYCIDIHQNGIEMLLKYYIKNLLLTNKYIINRNQNNIIINDDAFFGLINLIAKDEDNIIKSHKKNRPRCFQNDPYDKEMFKIENLMFKINDPVKIGIDSFDEYSTRFYNHYFNITNNEEITKIKNNMVINYLEGLKWVTLYYFDKCPCWDYYYKFDVAPFINDINAIYIDKQKNIFSDIKFKLGTNINPIEQLLLVLPPQSSYLLPKSVRFLVHNEKSPIYHLFPTDFEQDFISKHKYWMAIPLLPHIELNLVRKTFEKYKKLL
ncbi:putative capsid protein 3 [Chlorella virus XW01]|nr:putative capsid protein 3 [Chlorella virus XW01]